MRTSFSRTFTTMTMLLLVALLTIGAVFQWLAGEFLSKRAIDELKHDAQVISSFAQATRTEEGISNHDFLVAMSLFGDLTVHDVVIFTPAGKLSMCSHAPLGCQHQGLTLGSEYVAKILTSECMVDMCLLTGLYEDNRYVVAVPARDPDNDRVFAIVMVSSPVSQVRSVLDRIFDIYVSVSVFVAIISAVIVSFYFRRSNTPLRDMANTARAFGHGDLKARAKIDQSQPEEIQELAVAFNNMAVELEKSEYQRQEFVANVSHELKTPMTTIAGYVDGILDGTIPEHRHRQYLQVVSDETKRLNRLVRSMLDISRLRDRGGVPEEQKIHFDLCECMGRVLISFEQEIMERNFDVQVQMPEYPVYTIAHQDYVTQVIYNLVDNAVKFCPDGGVLALQIQESGQKVYISVANDGPTIPPEELPLVFDRFHKIDKSRTQSRDSWGLGLYIVKTIVCSHGEDISVTSRDGRTTFTFTMPKVH